MKTSPGLTGWAGETFQDDLKHSIRIWPHLNGTGGFYIALLEKSDCVSRKAVQPLKISHPDFETAAGSSQQRLNDTDRMFDILSTRFGINRKAFDDLQLLKKSRRDIYAVAADHRPPRLAKCISGLPLFHMHFKYLKPTTSCATALGFKADRNLIDLYPDQLQACLMRKPFALRKDQDRSCDSSGYVLVRYQNTVLGVGFYIQNQGVVASLLPKSMVVT